jgi:hypothetical protein
LLTARRPLRNAYQGIVIAVVVAAPNGKPQVVTYYSPEHYAIEREGERLFARRDVHQLKITKQVPLVAIIFAAVCRHHIKTVVDATVRRKVKTSANRNSKILRKLPQKRDIAATVYALARAEIPPGVKYFRQQPEIARQGMAASHLADVFDGNFAIISVLRLYKNNSHFYYFLIC